MAHTTDDFTSRFVFVCIIKKYLLSMKSYYNLYEMLKTKMFFSNSIFTDA